jgi:hypothetical protein
MIRWIIAILIAVTIFALYQGTMAVRSMRASARARVERLNRDDEGAK